MKETNKMSNSRFILIVYAILLLPACAHANDLNRKIKCATEIKTLTALVEKSDYIALYWVKEREPEDSKEELEAIKKLNEEDPFNRFINWKPAVKTFDFSLSHTLYGDPPDKFAVNTQRFLAAVPTEFFFMNVQHQKMVDKDTTIIGSAVIDDFDDGDCSVVPSLASGYLYIVFGGTLSRATVEPILSISHDPLYRKVESQIRKRYSE